MRTPSPSALAEITRLTKEHGHEAYVCRSEHEDGGWQCMFCAGGLTACTRCGGFEGAMPTQCPGETMVREVYDAVYAGTVDYRDGQWVNKPSLNCPSGWVERCKAHGFYWECSQGHPNAVTKCVVCGELRPDPL